MIHKQVNKHKPHIFFSYLRSASLERVKALMKTINSLSFSPRTLHTLLKYIMNGPLFVIKDKKYNTQEGRSFMYIQAGTHGCEDVTWQKYSS